MNTKVEAIIPLLSKKVSDNWDLNCSMLRQTIHSLLAVPNNFFGVTVVGHECPDYIGDMKRVTWIELPSKIPDKPDKKAKNIDKSLKLRLGLKNALEREKRWVFRCDADDFVSKKIPQFVPCYEDKYNAFVMFGGYTWKQGEPFLYKKRVFYKMCGSSNIIRLKPELFPTVFNKGKRNIAEGPHNLTYENLINNKVTVKKIKRPLVVYRVGNPISLSKNYVSNNYKNSLIEIIRATINRCSKIKLSTKIKNEFEIID